MTEYMFYMLLTPKLLCLVMRQSNPVYCYCASSFLLKIFISAFVSGGRA